MKVSSPNPDSLSLCSTTRARCRESFRSYTIRCCQNTEGVTMPSLGNALQELREERRGTQLRLEKLDQVISGIESLNGAGVSGKIIRPTRIVSAASRRKMALAQKARWASLLKELPAAVAVPKTGSAPAKRKISAAGRKRIAAAQRRRWAKLKGQAAAPKPKRHISAAGKKRIAAAQRARWAKIRAEKKAA